ncbi:hypothetical protein [Pseudomonas syringae]|uniref:hypothetical protein n=1 Tax=Pseudomonas syringae TaxID=317 RepID=UPI0032D8E7B8
MSKLTLGRMAKLYELHRSTLYEAVQKGRVSAGLDGKGQRVIDLSEMIRVYGEPPGSPTPKPDSSTPPPDSSPTPTGWAEMAAELRLLREEVAGLRQELRLIGHEGVRPQVEAQPPLGEVERPRAQSFADLLDALR